MSVFRVFGLFIGLLPILTFAQVNSVTSEKPLAKKGRELPANVTGVGLDQKLYLLVDNIVLKDVPSKITEEMYRTLLQEVLKTNEYQVLLKQNAEDAVANIDYQVLKLVAKKVKWGKNKTGHNLELALYDPYSKVAFQTTSIERVEKRQLVFATRKLFKLLFEKLQKERKKNESRVLDAGAFFESKKKGQARIAKKLKISDKKIKQREEELKKNANFQKRKLRYKEKAGESAFFDIPIEKIIKKMANKKKEGSTKDKNKDDVTAQIAKNEKNEGVFSAYDIPPAKVDQGGSFEMNWSASIGTYSTNILSQDIIEVQGNFRYLAIQGELEILSKVESARRIYAHVMYGRPLEESEFEIENMNSFEGLYSYTPEDWPIGIGAGLKLDSTPFVNLASLGGGLESANINMFWAIGELSKTLDLWIFPTRIYGKLQYGLLGNSDYGASGIDSITGYAYEVGSKIGVWGELSAALSLGSSSVTSSARSGFKNSSFYYSVMGNYRF